MAGNDWANKRAADDSDASMDEILASIRRIIAEDPIGSRPPPAAKVSGQQNSSGQHPPRQRIEPTLDAPRAAPQRTDGGNHYGGDQNSRATPNGTIASPPQHVAKSATNAVSRGDTDLDELFEPTASAVDAKSLTIDDGPTRSLRRAEPDMEPDTEPDTGEDDVNDLSDAIAKAASTDASQSDTHSSETDSADTDDTDEAEAEGEATVASTAASAADDSTDSDAASDATIVAASPTNDTDVDNLLSRLAASLSAQAAVAPNEDHARRAVADAVAAVAASNDPTANATQKSAPKSSGDGDKASEPTPTTDTPKATQATASTADPVTPPVTSPIAPPPTPSATPSATLSGATPAAFSLAAEKPAASMPASMPASIPASTSATATSTSTDTPIAPIAPSEPVAPPRPTATAADTIPQARSLEDSVADMLRPLLREWLDVHMPAMLEKALREELAARIPANPEPKA